ncbi:MAG: ATP-binding protein, partial [Actinomycetota bacterium]
MAGSRSGHERARRGAGIRMRTTVTAMFVVAVSLAIAGIALVLYVQEALRDDVRATARLRARAVTDQVSSGDQTFVAGDADEEFVQILGADGTILISSPNVRGDPVVVSLQPGEERILGSAPPEGGTFLVVAAAASGSRENNTVIVGRSLETVTEATAAMVRVLALAIPLLLFVVGLVTWLMVGRALAPVEGIRREVEAISSSELHRRVPDAPGGDEISRLASTMNRMLQRLEEGHRRERRLVSDASHELRSPIASIRQHAEVALSHPDATTTPELASVVLEEDVRLQRIVEDLLLLSSLDEGSLHLRMVPVDLDDLVLEEATRLRATTGLRIEIDAVSAGRVGGDHARLERLVRNLTENAARHARGVVALSLRATDGGVVFAVEDDGEGIEAEQRERIFERFVRLDEARDRDSGGSGLGLAIVRELAVAHGATLVVTDAHIGGARFEVRFP